MELGFPLKLQSPTSRYFPALRVSSRYREVPETNAKESARGEHDGLTWPAPAACMTV